jgi:hypothetical protein
MPLYLIVLSSLIVFCQSPSTISRATEIWEKAIAAKGGKEQLQKISNFLVVQRQVKGKRLPVYVDLCIFPDRYWAWRNYGGVLGKNVLVRDSTGIIEARDNQSGSRVLWFPPADSMGEEIKAQALFLMETKWFHPKILGLSEERLARETFDVVTVDAGRDLVKYYIDRKTSMVRRVSPAERYGNVVIIAEDMLNYQPLKGIMMPSRMSSPEGGTYDLEFAFDVEYDPLIFKRKPSIEDGPDGWKPVKKQTLTHNAVEN